MNLSQIDTALKPRYGQGGKRTTKARKHSGQGIRVLSVAQERRRWHWVLDRAEAADDFKAMTTALTRIGDMQRGRPYVARDPMATPMMPADDRLSSAIAKLLPGATVQMAQVQLPGKGEQSADDSQAIRRPLADGQKRKRGRPGKAQQASQDDPSTQKDTPA